MRRQFLFCILNSSFFIQEASVIFAGKAVFVTGAAKGIGREVAMRLAREGARVAMVDRDRDALEIAARDVSTANGGAALALAADVSRSDEVARAMEQAVTEFGGLDVLVNNAGIHFARALDE